MQGVTNAKGLQISFVISSKSLCLGYISQGSKEDDAKTGTFKC